MKLDLTIQCSPETDYRLSVDETAVSVRHKQSAYQIIIRSGQPSASLAVLIAHEIRGILNREAVQ